MGGYDITCDPGDLYTRKCYVNVHSPSGCVASDPACTVTQQEIISYTGGGDPISKGPSANKWQAWVPTLTSLDYTGTAYQPYGEAGLPFTATGIAGYSDTPFTDGESSDSGSTDSQVKSDGVSGGSAASKKGIPTWIGVIGAVGAIAGSVFGYKKWKAKQGTSVRSAEGEQSHLFGVDAVASGSWHCGKCRKTWDTQDDAEACCPTYSCPHCKENVTEIHVIESYSCPNCSANLGLGDLHKTAHPSWVGDRVIKNAETFEAESGVVLGKDSCCCGATAADPCACMIKGIMDCSATCPCSLAKDAESFDAECKGDGKECPNCDKDTYHFICSVCDGLGNYGTDESNYQGASVKGPHSVWIQWALDNDMKVVHGDCNPSRDELEREGFSAESFSADLSKVGVWPRLGYFGKLEKEMDCGLCGGDLIKIENSEGQLFYYCPNEESPNDEEGACNDGHGSAEGKWITPDGMYYNGVVGSIDEPKSAHLRSPCSECDNWYVVSENYCVKCQGCGNCCECYTCETCDKKVDGYETSERECNSCSAIVCNNCIIYDDKEDTMLCNDCHKKSLSAESELRARGARRADETGCERCGTFRNVHECWHCDTNLCIGCDPGEMRSDFDGHTYCDNCGPNMDARHGAEEGVPLSEAARNWGAYWLDKDGHQYPAKWENRHQFGKGGHYWSGSEWLPLALDAEGVNVDGFWEIESGYEGEGFAPISGFFEYEGVVYEFWANAIMVGGDEWDIEWDTGEVWQSAKESWMVLDDIFTVPKSLIDNSITYAAESFEAPYAGKGALMGITQNTDLSDFTPEELATSSAIHGDFNQASLNYSGHQNIEVRSAEDDKIVAYCINCGEGYDQSDWNDIQKGCALLKQPTTCWCGNDNLGNEGEETIKTPCCSEVVHEHSVEMCEDCNKCLVIRLGSGYEDGCCKCICIEVPSCGNIRNECVC